MEVSAVEIPTIIWKQKVTKSFKSGKYSNYTVQRPYTNIYSRINEQNPGKSSKIKNADL